jgi:hypothetical protein
VTGHDVVDQIPQLEQAARLQVEDALHVPLLGPADVGDRVVEAALLVLAVVPAGPVRARDLEVELLPVHEVARQLDRDFAHDDDACAVAARLCRGEQGLGRARRRGDDRDVDADPPGRLPDLVRDARVRTERVIGAGASRVLEASLVDVGGKGFGACSAQQAADHLADETATDHGDAGRRPSPLRGGCCAARSQRRS